MTDRLSEIRERVGMNTDIGPCIEWPWSKDQKGYGALYINGTKIQAHRAAYRLHVGKIPRGMLICHKCDNPKCINPKHLFAGTPSDNLRDCVKKGRHPLASKINCVRGHEFSPENTIWRRGHRYCRQCKKILAAKYRAAHRDRLLRYLVDYRLRKKAAIRRGEGA